MRRRAATPHATGRDTVPGLQDRPGALDRAVRPHRLSLLLASGLLACGSTEPSKPAVNQPATPQVPATPPSVSSDPTPVTPPPPVDATRAATVARSINAFAVDLHRTLAHEPGDMVVSPASIALAFAMTHAGARGDTERDIARVFHFPAGEPARLQADFAATLAGWSVAREGQELAVANRLYGERTVKFAPAYLDLTRTVFATPLEAVDFKTAAEPARQNINRWVAGRTHDKIVDLIPGGGLSEATRLVLVNAVYFKATWDEPFQATRTEAAKFHGSAGERPVKLMQRTDTIHLAVVADAKIRLVELPYQGGLFSLVVVLPDARDGLRAVEEALNADALAGWVAGAAPQRVAVKLPRFKIEPGDPLRLRDVLSSLGMASAFGGAADFTGMAPASEAIRISEAVHKAFIAVDEHGTEAAAATAVMAKSGGMPPAGEPIEFTADHPFLFFIRDTKTGAILFMGRLDDPKPY